MAQRDVSTLQKNIKLTNIDNFITSKNNFSKNIRSRNIKFIKADAGKKINIKGKTTEKLGVIGKEKAIACEVITSVIKYD